MDNVSTNPLEEYSLEELIDLPVDQLQQLEAERLAATPPYLIAEYLERLNVDQRRAVLRKLNEVVASEILSEMDADDSAEVVGAMRQHRASKVIEYLDPDDAVDMLGELDLPKRQQLLKTLEPHVSATLKELLQYDPHTAGGVMNPEVATVPKNITADEAITHIREIKEQLENISYIYVVDDQRRLLGTLRMRELILANSTTKVEQIMTADMQGVCTPDEDREDVAHKMAQLNFHALPVVDHEKGKLLGIVAHDDVIDILQAEATEDMQILVGAGADESIHDKVLQAVSHRAPWLLFNLLTASAAALVISLFEVEIQALPLLAVLMPVVAAIGGNSGQQSLAVAIRGLALNEIVYGENLKVSLKEALKGATNGILVGVIAGFAVWVITQNAKVAMVLSLATFLNTTLAGFSGAFIPLVLKHFGIDPAQSASIFLTTITDTAGFFIFLILSSLLIL